MEKCKGCLETFEPKAEGQPVCPYCGGNDTEPAPKEKT